MRWTQLNIAEAKRKGLITKEVIEDNRIRVQKGKPLTIPLAFLNGEFKKKYYKSEWNKEYKKRPAVKEKIREYHRKYQKEYNKRPAVKERNKKRWREYYHTKKKNKGGIKKMEKERKRKWLCNHCGQEPCCSDPDPEWVDEEEE